MYGKDWAKVSEFVGSRDSKQVANQGCYLRQKFREQPKAEGAHLLWRLEVVLPGARPMKNAGTTKSIFNR